MKTLKLNDSAEDRLSNIPDSLVLHIFSFLNAKQVVQTCVLSKRWVNLWKYLPTLTLFSSDFDNFDNFITFVTNILRHCYRDPSTSLHTLDFRHNGGLVSHLDVGLDPDLFNSILDYAVSHNVKQLRMSVKCDIEVFPSCIASYHGLTSLNFYVPPKNPRNPRCRRGKILFPDSLNMPSLTYLNIGFVAFHGGVDYFSTFPKLNRLLICHFDILGTQNLCISSTTLDGLVIQKYSNPRVHCKIELSTPSLSTFVSIGTPFQIVRRSHLGSLKHMEIYLDKIVNYAEAPSALLNLFQELADIKSLALYSTSLHVLSLFPDVCKVKLNSLRKLKTLIIKEKGLSFTLSELLINAKLAQNPAARSQEEVAKLTEELKEQSLSIPSEIIGFLLQNSPSAKFHIIN
ncbi:putative FBD-associated F-box protein At5g22720 [Vicia villosa]|uniref:putative FBD-associated F-box protein At5g22720 n=1 Tax=Vicia villosa TaxID=3911 RepID=UPI00273B72C4|nr:putative FBD-associated F-box protein At5g22720 [Vicia villosa]